MLTNLFIGSRSGLKSTSVTEFYTEVIVFTRKVVPQSSSGVVCDYTSMPGVIRLAAVPVSKRNFCAVSIEPLIVVAVLLLVTYKINNLF